MIWLLKMIQKICGNTFAVAPQALEQIIMETCESIVEALKENIQVRISKN